MPWVIPVIAVVGVAVAAAGAVQQGMAANQSAKYNAQAQENNATVARQQGMLQQDQANENARRIRQQGRAVAGAQRAVAGASGIGMTGSFQDVAFDSLINNELDALDATRKGSLGQWNSNIEANRYTAQAGLDRMQGRSAMVGGFLSAGSSLLSGASSAIGSMPRYSSPAKVSV